MWRTWKRIDTENWNNYLQRKQKVICCLIRKDGTGTDMNKIPKSHTSKKERRAGFSQPPHRKFCVCVIYIYIHKTKIYTYLHICINVLHWYCLDYCLICAWFILDAFQSWRICWLTTESVLEALLKLCFTTLACLWSPKSNAGKRRHSVLAHLKASDEYSHAHSERHAAETILHVVENENCT